MNIDGKGRQCDPGVLSSPVENMHKTLMASAWGWTDSEVVHWWQFYAMLYGVISNSETESIQIDIWGLNLNRGCLFWQNVGSAGDTDFVRVSVQTLSILTHNHYFQTGFTYYSLFFLYHSLIHSVSTCEFSWVAASYWISGWVYLFLKDTQVY